MGLALRGQRVVRKAAVFRLASEGRVVHQHTKKTKELLVCALVGCGACRAGRLVSCWMWQLGKLAKSASVA